MKIGELIRDIRKSKGITQKQLAEKCGISNTRVCEIEKSYKDMRISTLEEVIFNLGVSLSDFFSELELHDRKNKLQ